MSNGEQFREAMRRMASTVCLVTAIDAAGLPVGLASTSVVSLSLAPPTLLTCVNRTSSAWPVLAEAALFGVNLLRRDQVDAVRPFMTGQGRLTRFQDERWSLEDGAPLLRGAQAAVLCCATERLAHTTHTILVGEARLIWTADEIEPLLYLDGAFVGEPLLPVPGAA